MQEYYEKMKYIGGMIAYHLSSKETRKKTEENFSLGYFIHSKNILDKLIRFYVAEKSSRRGNERQLAQLHKEFWRGRSGRRFHEVTQKGTSFELNKNFLKVVEIAQKFVEDHQYNNFIEIGCGNGDVLRYMVGCFGESIENFIGLDLSAEQINVNTKANDTKNIKYIQADATEWVTTREPDLTLFMTHRGVFEYFNEEMLNRFLHYLSAGRNSILLIEPIDDDVNLDIQTDSFVFGYEYSFSHNYPRILKNNNFKIHHLEDRKVDKWRTLMIFAVADQN